VPLLWNKNIQGTIFSTKLNNNIVSYIEDEFNLSSFNNTGSLLAEEQHPEL
jgi:hypothetical protein